MHIRRRLSAGDFTLPEVLTVLNNISKTRFQLTELNSIAWLRYIAITCILLMSLSQNVTAQYSICGNVTMDGEPLAGATVILIESGDTVLTSNKGYYCFAGLKGGEYLIQALYKDFASYVDLVLVNDDITGHDMHILAITLEEVMVTGQTRAGERAIHSIKANVVNLAREARSSITVEELMNRTAGIRIRNSGGLGSNADIVVGGFTGKSIKFLIDGIPMDYLGSSMGLTKMPSDMADYIEVYKGVMPTEVGIDALGGAINIVTRKPTRTSHRLSYEIGSFNTHRFSGNSFIRINDKFSVGVNAFANYTRNNFMVDNLPVMDPTTGRTEFVRASLFHNGYRQYSGEAYLNFENRKWADLFRIKINSYALSREIQNSFTSRSAPYGEVMSHEHSYVVPSLYYKKRLFAEKLDITQFLVFSSVENQLVDSARNVYYDWYGNAHTSVLGSEMGLNMNNLEKPIIVTRLNNVTYRGLFNYQVGKHQDITLNIVNNYFHRVSDDLNHYRTKSRLDYNRFITNLGYQYHLLENRMVGLSQVKFLMSNTKGELFNNMTGRYEVPVQNTGWSFAQSLKYQSYSGWLWRASIENTFRLPDQMEIFGDNNFILPNITLKPEQSLNLNFGIRYKPNRRYNIELSTYMRNVKDLIRLKDVTQFQSLFLNLDNVRGYGVELEGQWRPIDQFTLSGNLTYNEFRFKGSNADIANNDHFINARVSNMPFYFGNANASYRFDRVFDDKDRLQIYWAYSYVHQFYLDFIEKQYEPDGFLGLYGKSKVYTNRVIPVQQIHSAGFVWTRELENEKAISLSAEANNIFDAAVYNTFKMQSAGRNYSLKLSYEF